MQKYKSGDIRQCEICGRLSTEYQVNWFNKYQKTLCGKHAAQMHRLNRILNETHYDNNDYIYHDKTAEIILKDKNYNIIAKAIIDIEDVEKCKKYKWFLSNVNKRNNSYVIAKNRQTRKQIYLHRYVIGYEGSLQVDHLDHNTLNNTKENLKISTVSENNSNRRFSNITFCNGLYLARLNRDYIKYYFGSFKTKEEAFLVLEEARKTYKQDKNLFHEKYQKYKVGV